MPTRHRVCHRLSLVAGELFSFFLGGGGVRDSGSWALSSDQEIYGGGGEGGYSCRLQIYQGFFLGGGGGGLMGQLKEEAMPTDLRSI